jgi:hypothetical protein
MTRSNHRSRSPRRRLTRAVIRRLVPAALALAAVAGVLSVSGSAPQVDSVADLSQFNPGNIISDEVFFFSGSMTAPDVQAFLDGKAPNCVSGSDGTPCLRVFRQNTNDRAADAYCGGYVGAAQESAATIITKVATSCGINPKVLLVMLEKERGLIRASGSSLTSSDYRIAMGYGCPDTAPCDAEYFGFQNQVYKAAWQMQKYAKNPANYTYRAGRTVNIYWHPNAACGAAPVYIENQATAGLYNYTPYQPNGAALGRGGDSGCASYGNRNFWMYFTDWFISTQSDAVANASPRGNLEFLALTPSGVRASGWAFDPDAPQSPVTLRIVVDGVTWNSGRTFAARPDVANVFGVGGTSGFDVETLLNYGQHLVCVMADNAGGLGVSVPLGCQTLTFTNRRPQAGIEQFSEQPDGSVVVSGWAFDPEGAPGQVHVYVNGRVVTWAQASGARPDIQAAFPEAGPNSGFSVTLGPLAGGTEVCVYSIDTLALGNNWLVGCKSLSYRAPVGWVDAVSETTEGQLRVTGWTLDPSAPPTPLDVHVYVDGRIVTWTQASVAREDVGRVFPAAGPAHGFDVTISAAPGEREVCVYAINVGFVGPHPLLEPGCRTVTLEYAAPRGRVDAVTHIGAGRVAVAGWVWDPSVPTAPLSVHYYVDGSVRGVTEASESRPDVGAALPAAGSRHGFWTTLDVGFGRHEICAYAINVGVPGPHPLISCRTIDVADLAPIGAVAPIVKSGPGQVAVWGWTFDPDSPAATTSVRVHVDGVDRGVFAADASLPDVGAAYPAAGAAHGFGTSLGVSAGEHEICVSALSAAGQTGSTSLGCARVTV